MQHASKEERERYKCFLEQMRYDGEFLWSTFGAFLLPQTVFLGFLLSVGFGEENPIGWSLGLFIAALVGVVLSIVWIATFRRSMAYYHFTVAQVREVEPPGWDLFKGRREKFRDGYPVKIDGCCYQTKGLLRIKVRWAIQFVIYTFIGTYVIVAILRGPWMKLN